MLKSSPESELKVFGQKCDAKHGVCMLYFYSYKTERFFSFQNNPKNLDPSYKTDLDLWDCLGKVKQKQNFKD